MPGFTKDQVDISIDQGLLTISAKRESAELTDAKTHLNERRFTRIRRQFTLPTTVDPDQRRCDAGRGVLTLRLLKKEEVKPRKIHVK